MGRSPFFNCAGRSSNRIFIRPFLTRNFQQCIFNNVFPTGISNKGIRYKCVSNFIIIAELLSCAFSAFIQRRLPLALRRLDELQAANNLLGRIGEHFVF